MAKLMPKTTVEVDQAYVNLQIILASLANVADSLVDQAYRVAGDRPFQEDWTNELGDPGNTAHDIIQTLRDEIQLAIIKAGVALERDHHDRDSVGLAPCPAGEYGA